MLRKCLGSLAGIVCVIILSLVLARLSPGASTERLAAFTIDDGPKPPVLYGLNQKTLKPTGKPGLLEVLDKAGIKATFFYMGWRLDALDKKNAENIKAARDVHARGHQIENHTNGHGPFRKMVFLRGEEWVLKDIDLGAERIKSITGKKPQFLRPPEWSIWPELKEKIEARGYTVVTKSVNGIHMPLLLVDVDTEDWAYYEKEPTRRPFCGRNNQPGENLPNKNCLVLETLKKIEARERAGLLGHLLVFHELNLTAGALPEIIQELKNKGYKFVALEEYFKTYGDGR